MSSDGTKQHFVSTFRMQIKPPRVSPAPAHGSGSVDPGAAGKRTERGKESMRVRQRQYKDNTVINPTAWLNKFVQYNAFLELFQIVTNHLFDSPSLCGPLLLVLFLSQGHIQQITLWITVHRKVWLTMMVIFFFKNGLNLTRSGLAPYFK